MTAAWGPSVPTPTDALRPGDLVCGTPRHGGSVVAVFDTGDATIGYPGGEAAVWLRSLDTRPDGTAYRPYAVNVGWADEWQRVSIVGETR